MRGRLQSFRQIDNGLVFSTGVLPRQPAHSRTLAGVLTSRLYAIYEVNKNDRGDKTESFRLPIFPSDVSVNY